MIAAFFILRKSKVIPTLKKEIVPIEFMKVKHIYFLQVLVRFKKGELFRENFNFI